MRGWGALSYKYLGSQSTILKILVNIWEMANSIIFSFLPEEGKKNLYPHLGQSPSFKIIFLRNTGLVPNNMLGPWKMSK